MISERWEQGKEQPFHEQSWGYCRNIKALLASFCISWIQNYERAEQEFVILAIYKWFLLKHSFWLAVHRRSFLPQWPEQPLMWSQRLNIQPRCVGPPRLSQPPSPAAMLAVPVLAGVLGSGPQRRFKISDFTAMVTDCIIIYNTSGGRSTYWGEWEREVIWEKFPDLVKIFCGLGNLI